MTPYWRNEQHGLTLLHADVLDGLRALAACSVQCVVSSPPYWGLRDYGTASWEGGDPECEHVCGGQVQDSKAQGAISAGVRPGCKASACRKCGAVRVDAQIGLEPTPEAYVARMVEVFREVKRVLRDDGCVWLNLGDSFAGSGKGGQSEEMRSQNWQPDYANKGLTPPGLKPKDLCMIPSRVALALQADGWWLRSDIIWAKPNPMPESVTDRPTSAHEHVFLLAKSQRYFYDQEAVKEQGVGSHPKGPNAAKIPNRNDQEEGYRNACWGDETGASGRNLRNVWTIPTSPFPQAHFAVFPPKLAEPCVKAGSAARACSKCGTPWERVVEIVEKGTAHDTSKRALAMGHTAVGPTSRGGITPDNRQTLGFRPACDCDGDAPCICGGAGTNGDGGTICEKCNGVGHLPPEPVPSIVLDPFAGSGTTMLVAYQQGRHAIGIELSADYCDMAVKRLEKEIAQGRLFEPGETTPKPVQTTLEVTDA